MENINSILQSFDTITLDEMDAVKLQDRMDTKFIFPLNKLAHILENIKPNYKVLTINQTLIGRYKTLYYDTPDLYLYKRHHAGKLNRYKVRHRKYVESNIGFLEVKFKNNKGRTIKQRIIKNDWPKQWEADTEQFLNTKTPYNPQNLIPSIWVNYSRITLVNSDNAERLTIDLNLEFLRNGDQKLLNNLVIAEVKREGKKPSPFIKLMRQFHLHEGSISKYCMGLAMSIPSLKSNNFKPTLLTINKIIKNDISTNSNG